MSTGDRVRGRDVAEESYERLARHLQHWLGSWPVSDEVVVVHSPFRERPGWDGMVRHLVGVATPTTTVLSVAERYLRPLQDAVARGGLVGLEDHLGEIFARDKATLRRGVFRYCQRLVDHEERGIWVDPNEPDVPEWLRPFNGDVLVAYDAEGTYAAGVGRKRHDEFGQELSIVTEETHRHMGYARELVAQAARRVYDEGSIVTYLHSPDNVGSAAVAEATGFYDQGWSILSLAGSIQ